MSIKWPMIKDMRLLLGKNTSEFVDDTGVCLSYLSEIENGRKTPSLKMQEKIAKGLNLPVWELQRLLEMGEPESLRAFIRARYNSLLNEYLTECEALRENNERRKRHEKFCDRK